MIRIKSLLLITLIACVLSCNKQDDAPNILINIENEFSIALTESLKPGDNPLLLHISTVDLLDCTNYQIIHSHAVSDAKIVASIDHLAEPEVCDPGSDYATADISLGALANGVYDFQINLEQNSIINNGTLTITEQDYTLDLETSHGVDILTQDLKKTPDGYFWGEINLAEGIAPNVMANFMAELLNIADAHDLSKGMYSQFEIDDNQNFDLTLPPLLTFTPDETATFIFKLNGAEATLSGILDNYRSNHFGKINIRVYTSEGETL